MADNGNGRASLTVILWVMGTVFLGGLTMLTNSVIANDRIREAKDEALRIDYTCKIDKVKDDFTAKAEIILLKLTKMEAHLGK